MNAVILYYTKTGHTLEAISPIAQALQEKGVSTNIVLAKDFDSTALNDIDIFIVGTPCWGGSSGITGVATPIQKALKKINSNALEKVKCFGVAVHAKYGGEATLNHLEKLLKNHGAVGMVKAPIAKAGVLTSIVKGKSVTPQDEQILYDFAESSISDLNKRL